MVVWRVVIYPYFYFTRTIDKNHILTNLKGPIHLVKDGKALKGGLHKVERVSVGDIINFLQPHFNFFKINRTRVDRWAQFSRWGITEIFYRKNLNLRSWRRIFPSPLNLAQVALEILEGHEMKIVFLDVLVSHSIEKQPCSMNVDAGKEGIFGIIDLHPVLNVEGLILVQALTHWK